MLQTVKRMEEKSTETPLPTVNNVNDDVVHVIGGVSNDAATLSKKKLLETCVTHQVSRSIKENSEVVGDDIKVVNLGHKKRICAKQENAVNKSHRRRTIYCCVYGCTANSFEMPHLAFFSFPETPLRCKVWTRFTKRRTIRETIIYEMHSSPHRMCSAHFQIYDFVDATSRNKLVENAVPSVFDSKYCPWFKDKDYMPATLHEDTVDCGVSKSVNVTPADLMSSSLDLVKIDRWDLCEYHRMIVRSVTLVGIELKDVKFCIKCGSSVNVPVLISDPNVFKINCKKGHVIIITTELNAKFQDYVLACQKGHRLRGDSDPPCHSPCHLCNDHYVPPHAVSQQNGERKPRFVVSAPKKKRGRPAQKEEQTNLPQKFPSLVNHLFHFPLKVKYTADVAVSCDENQPLKVKTTSSWTQLSVGELKSAQQINDAMELKKLRESVSKLEMNRKTQKFVPAVTERQLIDNILPKYCRGVTLKLIEMQILMAVHHKARWPVSLITLAKVIENENRPAYNIIKKLLRFPPKSVLNKYDLVPSKMSAVTFITEMFDKRREEIEPLSPEESNTEEEQFDETKQLEKADSVNSDQEELSEVTGHFVKVAEGGDDIPQISLPEKDDDTSSSAVTTILDEAIKELELKAVEENTAIVLEQIEEVEGVQNENTVVLELMGGDSEMSRFRILGSAIQDYETGVYQILAESVDSPEHGVESLEVHVVPFDKNDNDE